MILNKRHLKKVLEEVSEAVSFGVEIAACRPGIVKPADIDYYNAVALPFLNQRQLYPDCYKYSTQLLQETLLLIQKDELPIYLQRSGVVRDDHRLINVGAILKRITKKRKETQLNRKKTPNKRQKGKRR